MVALECVRVRLIASDCVCWLLRLMAVGAEGSYFDGLHLHLCIDLDASCTLDAYAQVRLPLIATGSASDLPPISLRSPLIASDLPPISLNGWAPFDACACAGHNLGVLVNKPDCN